MYLDYFSLQRHPFRITPDTSLFFSGGNQGRGVVLDAMLFAIESGEGILKVVGEVGSGKTMLCRMLEERLPATTEIVYLANPRLSPDEIVYAIAFELKLPVRRDTSKLLVMQQLQNYLIKQHTANRRVLVIIEEAQGMSLETLEEIRLFSNLETQVDKLMQIILFGQPELDKNLSTKNIRQLRERITHSFHLNPLTATELSEYVRFRLGGAGCPCPQLFTRRAEWLLSKASGGLTRRINILADKALLAAFAENVLDDNELNAGASPVITARHVWAAIRDSGYIAAALRSIFLPLRVVGVGVVAAAVAIAILIWPEAGSFGTQAAVLGKVSDQRFEKLMENGSQHIAGVAKAQVEPESNSAQAELQKTWTPRLSPIAVGQAVSPLSSEGNATAATTEIAERYEYSNIDSVAAAIEPSLLEGFEQPSWVGAIPSTPTAKSLGTAEISFATATSRSQLQDRLLASIEWLRESRGSGYTVQFISGDISDLDFADSFLRVLDRHDLIAGSFVCMSSIGNQSYWTIKYGNFNRLSLAQNFIDSLPANIFEYKPFVQNMSSVECNANNSIAALILE